MATVTSLTEAKIQELMAGWEGVSLSQDEINALVQQLWNNNETQDAVLTEFKEVTVPALQDDLAAGSVRVSDLNDVTIPDLQATLDQHDLNLTNLNTVDIPNLNSQLNSNSDWILEFDSVTIPALQAQLDTNTGDINNLNTVTLPGLDQRLTSVEATAGGSDFDPTYLQGQIDANTTSISDLNTVTLPALDSRLDTLETAPGFDDTALQNQLDILNGKFPVVGDDIAADTITANQIATDAVTANEIAAHTITAMEIAADTITANEIAADSITASEIAARTITAMEIAADAITANEIAADAITASEIAARTITALEIAADAITANEIAADTITAAEIASRTITALEIAADTITANEIAADTITANEMKADSITAREIASRSITALEVAADTLTANEIAADSITANEIAGRTITALEIATDAITANEIAADTITANEIAADTITANEVDASIIIADSIYSQAGYFGLIEASQVNAELILASEIYSPLGYFGKVSAEQIESGSMRANVGLLGSLAVGEILINNVGISVPGPVGLTLLSATGSGHRFAGAVETDDVTINGGLTVNAKNNTVNGEIKLSNVVVPPSVKPSATRYWPYTVPTGTDVMGLTDNHTGTEWVSINTASGHKVQSFNKTTGARVQNFAEDYWAADYVPYNITRAGNYFFMVCWRKSTNEWWLCRVGNAYGSFNALVKIASAATIGSIAVGRDDTNGQVICGWPSAGGGTYTMRNYDYNGALIGNNYVNVTEPGGRDWIAYAGTFCMSVGRGPVGRNGEDEYFAVVNGTVRFFDPVAKTLKWWPGDPEGIKGVCVEYGTTNKLRFLGYSTYRVYEWVREATWNDNVPIDIAYSWFDSKVAGTGTHETTISPVLSFTSPWTWSAIQIDASAPSNTGGDDSPDSVVVYMNNQRQTPNAVGKSSAIFRQILAGAAPKAANEFVGAAAYPGSLLAAATMPDGITPRFKVGGDGRGNWGDLTVDGNGKAVIGGDTGWIAVTAFTNMWENYGSVYAPVGYRKIGSRVFLRGLIRGPGGLGGSMFTLPVGFRPLYNQIHASIMTQVSDTFSATGENSATFNTGSSGTGTSGTGHVHTVNIPTLDVTTVVTLANIGGRIDIKPDGTVSHAGGATWQGSTEWASLEGISFLID